MNSAVDGLTIKAQMVPSDSTTGSMSEGVPGESRADELVWVAGCAVSVIGADCVRYGLPLAE